MRIGVAGIAGRMGRVVVEEILNAGAKLAGGTLLAGDIAPAGTPTFVDIDDLSSSSDVIIDFTTAATVQTHAAALASRGIAWILGTTGLSAADERAVQAASGSACVVRAANFSPGVNLVLELAERMGALLSPDAYDAEIVEMHHRQKIDAPSGTAWALGQAIASGRGQDLAGVAVRGRDGQTGARIPGQIGFASVRGGQIVGEHTISFTADDEQVTLTHRAFDRRSFARGAVRAALWTEGRPPGLYSMRDVQHASQPNPDAS